MEFLKRIFAPEQKSVSTKLVRNTLFSALNSVLLFPIPFLLIPFILGRVGVGKYGIYAVLLTVVSFTSLTDMGMAGTLAKHVAEYHAKGDIGALERLLDTGLMLYVILSLVVMSGLCVSTGRLLPALLRNTSTPYLELRHLWLVMILTMGVNILTAPYASVVNGLQRMDLSSALSFVVVISNAVFTVAFLMLGWRLEGLVYAKLVGALLSLALLAASAHRLLPQISMNPLRFDLKEMKDVLQFQFASLHDANQLGRSEPNGEGVPGVVCGCHSRGLVRYREFCRHEVAGSS